MAILDAESLAKREEERRQEVLSGIKELREGTSYPRIATALEAVSAVGAKDLTRTKYDDVVPDSLRAELEGKSSAEKAKTLVEYYIDVGAFRADTGFAEVAKDMSSEDIVGYVLQKYGRNEAALTIIPEVEGNTLPRDTEFDFSKVILKDSFDLPLIEDFFHLAVTFLNLPYMEDAFGNDRHAHDRRSGWREVIVSGLFKNAGTAFLSKNKLKSSGPRKMIWPFEVLYGEGLTDGASESDKKFYDLYTLVQSYYKEEVDYDGKEIDSKYDKATKEEKKRIIENVIQKSKETLAYFAKPGAMPGQERRD